LVGFLVFRTVVAFLFVLLLCFALFQIAYRCRGSL
jgi:hypothetical protein